MPVPRPKTREDRAAERIEQRQLAHALGARIDELGLTRIEVAIRMGVDPAQLSRWMNGAVRWQDGPEDFRVTVSAAIDELAAERGVAA